MTWETPAGKQVVASGHGQLIGYGLKTGVERWSVAGMPSGCCASPVAADGILFRRLVAGAGQGIQDAEFR